MAMALEKGQLWPAALRVSWWRQVRAVRQDGVADSGDLHRRQSHDTLKRLAQEIHQEHLKIRLEALRVFTSNLSANITT